MNRTCPEDERPLRVQVPRPRCPKHARQEFAAVQRRDHEPAFPSAATSAAYPCRAVPAIHRACNIRCLDIALCQVLQTGRREDQRPVGAGTSHTTMVCTPACAVKSLPP